MKKFGENSNFISDLQQKLNESLPGHDAQLKMAPVIRNRYQPAPDSAVAAGVLALFFPKNSEWHIVLIERVISKRINSHSGQISFPGGKLDPTDVDLRGTALRETEEEVGIKANQIQLLGELTSLYIPVSNFLVHPFVGMIPDLPAFVPEPAEVSDILEVPFSLFHQTETIRKKDLKVGPNIYLKNVPYFEINGKVLWGATAMIMSELLEVSRAIN